MAPWPTQVIRPGPYVTAWLRAFRVDARVRRVVTVAFAHCGARRGGTPTRQDYRHRDSAEGIHIVVPLVARTTGRLFEETCSRAVLCLDPEPFVRPVRVAVALRDDSLETESDGGVE